MKGMSLICLLAAILLLSQTAQARELCVTIDGTELPGDAFAVGRYRLCPSDAFSGRPRRLGGRLGSPHPHRYCGHWAVFPCCPGPAEPSTGRRLCL